MPSAMMPSATIPSVMIPSVMRPSATIPLGDDTFGDDTFGDNTLCDDTFGDYTFSDNTFGDNAFSYNTLGYGTLREETFQFFGQTDALDGPVPAALRFERYNMMNRRRGRAIIINNENFNYQLTRQHRRDGTSVDAAALESVFGTLGFEVTRYDDLTSLDTTMNLRSIASEDHSDADCFALAILSHGEEGYIYATNGKVKVETITKLFKGDACPSLAGKPKLFFIQACRGRHYDWGVETVADSDEVDAAPMDPSIRKIPLEADVLIAYSVVPGYFSWRNNVDGSWFIQALVDVLRAHGLMEELMQMLTLVNKMVAYNFESCTDEEFTSGMKQVPCIASTLTKQVYFMPKFSRF